jgi:hypothetical protein
MNINVNIPPRTPPPPHQTKTQKHKKHIQKKDKKNTKRTTKHPKDNKTPRRPAAPMATNSIHNHVCCIDMVLHGLTSIDMPINHIFILKSTFSIITRYIYPNSYLTLDISTMIPSFPTVNTNVERQPVVL